MFRCFWCINTLSKVANFSTTSKLFRNHYDALGITPKATQTDIKSAYYKLSMQYHPDKNKGSLDASKKFQDITAAYEILGNFKLRKLYDKGILHTAGDQFAHEVVVEEEHPEHKFYKSRHSRHDAPNMSGKTPIYDFDEWSRSHYGATFARANRAKVRHAARQEKIERDKNDVKSETLMIGVFSIFFMCMLVSYIRDTTTGYDHISLSENIVEKHRNNNIK